MLGAYRVSAALEQVGIKLSRVTCGRYLSINRSLYHLQMLCRPRHRRRIEQELAEDASQHGWQSEWSGITVEQLLVDLGEPLDGL